ncbi:hypothetical protein CK223_29870 [Mesorhizobium loti]|nr:hypothetical protein CK223_29870 [Mesorhizobium loti]
MDRNDKRNDGQPLLRQIAPLAGAWIETSSRKSRCWSKQVAPLAGAWIETRAAAVTTAARCVAPLAGAWIETIR